MDYYGTFAGITVADNNTACARTGRWPLVEAIAEIVAGGAVRIACPFIGFDYITGLLSICPSWRILTDVEEFICCRKLADRMAAAEFIAQHRSCLRHAKDLHAKIVVGSERAMVGSANLTMGGLTGRQELAVIVESPEHVTVLARWFDDLWAAAAELDGVDVLRFVDSIPVRRDDRDNPTRARRSPR